MSSMTLPEVEGRRFAQIKHIDLGWSKQEGQTWTPHREHV
jgi:hypothetical protein